MLFDIAWPELMLIGAIALVVIGPKDLPRALRTAGFWVRKARSLSREFQASVDQMIREAELDEMRRDIQKATEFDLEKEVKSAIDPTGELEHSIKPPDTPDFFDDAPARTVAADAPAIELEALPPPAEAALSEQPMLPFEEPLLLPADSVSEGAPQPADAAAEPPVHAAEPAPAPAKP